MIGGRGEDRIDRPATYGTHMEHVNSNITRRWAYHAATREREREANKRSTNWQFSAGHGNVRGSFEISYSRPTNVRLHVCAYRNWPRRSRGTRS